MAESWPKMVVWEMDGCDEENVVLKRSLRSSDWLTPWAPRTETMLRHSSGSAAGRDRKQDGFKLPSDETSVAGVDIV